MHEVIAQVDNMAVYIVAVLYQSPEHDIMYAVASLFTHTSSFPLCYSAIIVSICFSLKSCVVYAPFIKKFQVGIPC